MATSPAPAPTDPSATVPVPRQSPALSLADDPRASLYRSPGDIQAMVKCVGEKIIRDHAGRRVLLVQVRTGGLFFAADLARSLNGHVQLEMATIRAASYPPGQTRSSGRVKLDLSELPSDLSGYVVIIVDDVADSCRTLDAIRRALADRQNKSRRPAELYFAVAFDKPDAARRQNTAQHRERVLPHLRYVGFGNVPAGHYLVGYGMDADLDWRPGDPNPPRELHRADPGVYYLNR